ncbi:hypothetical protein FDECE_7607 [Fusarium decemcellulare]|nr:hypothetical protein FDECE_7607 [Fusarium decemcellulare]
MSSQDDEPSTQNLSETLSNVKEISIRCKALLLELSADDRPTNGFAAREQAASFNTWAANMNIFREGQQSLAYQLRSAPEIGELAHQLLVVLERDLENCLLYGDQQQESLSEVESDESSDRSSPPSSILIPPTKDDEATPQPTVWTSIQNTITSLRQLALAVHRASAHHRQARIERFMNIEGNREVCETFERCARQKVDHLFPKASETLRKRLAQSISTRRARFSYLEKHQKKVSALTKPAPTLQTNKAKTDEKPSAPPPVKQHQTDNFVPTQSFELGANIVSRARLPKTMVTKPDPKQIKPVRDNSTESVTSVKISTGNPPSRPKLDPTATSFTCPYCFLVCPATEVDGEAQWRERSEAFEALEKHVVDHLISVSLILAPIETGEWDEGYMYDMKSEAQRDDDSECDLDAVSLVPGMRCNNDACDCWDQRKNSVPTWSTIEAVFESWVDTLADKLPTNHDDPSHGHNANLQEEWEFWYPLSLPPDCQPTGSSPDQGLAGDRKLMKYFKIDPPPFHQGHLKPITFKKPLRVFLPLSDVDAIITYDSIMAQLSWTTRFLSQRVAENILGKAKRVFAILILTREPWVIRGLINEDICDEDLPLRRNRDKEDSKHYTMVSPGSGKTFLSFNSSPKEQGIVDFLDKQWLVQAPILDGSGQQIVLDRKCPLPFIEYELFSTGYLSKTYKGKLHPAHQRIFSGHYIMIKEAYDKEIFEKERDDLEAIKNLRNKHLIKHIATIEKGSTYYLMFPWAGGGNLRNFWKSEDSKPRTFDLIFWALQQMLGLADAVKVLHERNISHGIIQPQTILYFPGSSQGDHDILVFADMGVLRGYRGSYEIPERETDRRMGRPESRRYDLWVLGCMVLEFTVWLVYNWEAVEAFRRHRETSPSGKAPISDHFFIRSSEGSMEIHSAVVEVMQHLREHPSCGLNTALGDLLTLAGECLLQIQPENRVEAGELCSRLEKIVGCAREMPGYLVQQTDPPSAIPNFFECYHSDE